MTWTAGAIKGRVGVDESPAVQGLERLAKSAAQTKSVFEKELGGLSVKLKADPSSFVTSARGAAEKAGAEAGEGWAAGFAKSAKALRKDDRLSGETALGGFMRGGLTSQADLALSAVGLGATASIIEGVGKSLNQLVEGAHALSAEYRKGSINAADMAMAVGKNLPVLGEVVKLGENLNDVFTGQKTYIEETKREQELLGERMRTSQAYAQTTKEIFASYKDSIRAAKTEAEALKAVLAGDAEKAGAIRTRNATETEADAEEKRWEAAKKEIRDKLKEKNDPLNSRRTDLQDKLTSYTGGGRKTLDEALEGLEDRAKRLQETKGLSGKDNPYQRKIDEIRGWAKEVGQLNTDIQANVRKKNEDLEKLEGDHNKNLEAIQAKGLAAEKIGAREAQRERDAMVARATDVKTDAAMAAKGAALRERGDVHKAERLELEAARDRDIRAIEKDRKDALASGKAAPESDEAKKINADADEAVLKRKEVHAAAMRDLEAKQARQTLSIEEETKAKQLQLADDALGAELKRIEASYAEKYATADAGNKKLLLKQEDADKALAKQAAARRTEAMQSDVKARELDMKGDDQGAVVERAKQKYVEAVRAAGTDPKAREAAAKSFVMDVTGGLQEAPRAFAPASQMFSQQIVPMSSGPESPVQKLQGIKDTLEKILTAVDPKNAKVVEAVLKDITPVTVGG